MAKRKSSHFDEHGRKIPSQHSPLWQGRRVAGPRGNEPRWRDSVLLAWHRIDARDGRRRLHEENGYDVIGELAQRDPAEAARRAIAKVAA
jgi:hypothetical protein